VKTAIPGKQHHIILYPEAGVIHVRELNNSLYRKLKNWQKRIVVFAYRRNTKTIELNLNGSAKTGMFSKEHITKSPNMSTSVRIAKESRLESERIKKHS